MGGFVGLNYLSVEFLFKLYEVSNPRDMLEKLQEIERGALEAIAREQEES